MTDTERARVAHAREMLMSTRASIHKRVEPKLADLSNLSAETLNETCALEEIDEIVEHIDTLLRLPRT